MIDCGWSLVIDRPLALIRRFGFPFLPRKNVRAVRQYLLEVDFPEHIASRKLLESIFLRPKLPEF